MTNNKTIKTMKKDITDQYYLDNFDEICEKIINKIGYEKFSLKKNSIKFLIEQYYNNLVADFDEKEIIKKHKILFDEDDISSENIDIFKDKNIDEPVNLILESIDIDN